MVVMSSWLLDATLSAVVSSSRYDLGWYAGRSFGFVAACCLLITLLFEMNRLYDRLIAALALAQTLQLDLTFRAENNSLTGLPNRALFYDRLAMAMTRCRRSKNLMALLYVDIDDFKKINDGLGHAAGDELLRWFAKRLSQSVRAADTVAQGWAATNSPYSGKSSFPRGGRAGGCQAHGRIAAPLEPVKTTSRPKASVGIAYFTDGDLKPDELVKQADAALYRAKQNGRNRYWVHVPQADTVARNSPLIVRQQFGDSFDFVAGIFGNPALIELPALKDD